ncbi:Uncharacterised protein [Vibrio cholerae]|nr:Uncharacterised protein [Vibrio cholerae]CSI06534.1 Uncharacterised protein [Vibrio cholerae]
MAAAGRAGVTKPFGLIAKATISRASSRSRLSRFPTFSLHSPVLKVSCSNFLNN